MKYMLFWEGLEKKIKIFLFYEKKKIVFYEVGYVVLGWFLEYCVLLLKVIVICVYKVSLI